MPCMGVVRPIARISFMKTTRPTRFHLKSGFTLLEMVIVLGIIAMILGGAIYASKGILSSSKFSRVEGDFKAIDSNLMAYKIMTGNYPTTQQGLDALTTRPTSAPVPKRWEAIMKSLPEDPWKNSYGYRFPGRKNTSEPEITSKGPDGQEGTQDDLSSQDD